MNGQLVEVLLAKAYDPDVRVRRTVSALVAAGFEVRVLAWDRTGRHLKMQDDRGALIQRIRVRSRASRGWTQVFYLARVALRMLPLLRERRPTVLHAVNLPMLAVAIAVAPLLGQRRPMIVYDAFEIHALMGIDRYPRWLTALIALIERTLPRFADLVITPGDDRRRYFQSLGIKSVAVANWIDPPANPPDRAAARASLGIAPDQFCVAYVGGIIGSRDLAPLLEHARRRPADVVLIAGTGDAVEELAVSADGLPNVRVLGWQPDPGPTLSAADALYYALKPDHPYARHAAPNNLYQAIARAIPLLYRAQGELEVVGRKHRIGIPFVDQASLESAIDTLRDEAANEAIRAELTSLQTRFSEKAHEAGRTAAGCGPPGHGGPPPGDPHPVSRGPRRAQRGQCVTDGLARWAARPARRCAGPVRDSGPVRADLPWCRLPRPARDDHGSGLPSGPAAGVLGGLSPGAAPARGTRPTAPSACGHRRC
jgi:hypothetical protein